MRVRVLDFEKCFLYVVSFNFRKEDVIGLFYVSGRVGFEIGRFDFKGEFLKIIGFRFGLYFVGYFFCRRGYSKDRFFDMCL